MKMNMLTSAGALSDEDLLVHIDVLAGTERHASAELVAHLAVLRTRPALYAGKGYGSLFSYCTQALRLSEDAACNRIEAAKACQRFPVILDLLASGAMTLTSVRVLGPHLTVENHEVVLEKARGRTRHQIDALVAELAPRPDVPSSIRKVPAPTVLSPASPVSPAPISAAAGEASAAATAVTDPPLVLRPMSRPIVKITAPGRYHVQFTFGQDAHDRLRRLQALLCREIPRDDQGAIFARALKLLEADVVKTKLGVSVKTRRSIRLETDRHRCHAGRACRYVPYWVKQVVWRRDGGQCAFVSPAGRRCTERTFLEFHHVETHAKGGPATVENISLRCRCHNQYEAELVFGPRGAARVRQESGNAPRPAPVRAHQPTPSRVRSEPDIRTVPPRLASLVSTSIRTPRPGL